MTRLKMWWEMSEDSDGRNAEAWNGRDRDKTQSSERVIIN